MMDANEHMHVMCAILLNERSSSNSSEHTHRNALRTTTEYGFIKQREITPGERLRQLSEVYEMRLPKITFSQHIRS
jgi:hypothetical protein